MKYIHCACYYILSVIVEKNPTTNLYGDEYYYHPLETQGMLFVQVISH